MFEREQLGPIRLVRMARGKGNAMNAAFLEGIVAELDDAEASPDRALILTGQGKTFCAGVDLFAVAEGGEEYLKGFLPILTKSLLRALSFRKPLIAAVNGHAIAGGAILAMACDVRVMSQGSGKFGLTELKVGVPFPTIALEIARHGLPQAAFREAIYSARLYSPEEVRELGVVEELVDPDSLLERARERAMQLAQVPAEAFRITKEQSIQPVMDRFERHWPIFDAQVYESWLRPETAATIRDFLSKTVSK